MTLVAHSLTGIALLAVASSPKWTWKEWAVGIPVFAVLENAPDAPLPGWGHDRYEVSHSIFVTVLAAATLFGLHLIARKSFAGYQVSSRVALAACAAWISHIFLDSFYGQGKGIQVMWPFGEGRLNFPIPWFETLGTPPVWVGAHSMKVFAIEFACYAPLTVLCLVLAIRRDRYVRL